ncbi:hypothetical protein PPTG_24824 [Phytophthora nicotianae INRA-310]|uniref:Uncharacterized protein n=2 Tax=Phytophthora nicotianae (strain INRA-310) TaxID=761204 RepID=W2PCT7_PHYN3|nr:hypothetical protein PPTG_24824 [Phytophthora nicotianae INRA-310]ETM97804.1 hypothetical protein PPTG_24824 [Phytophthora nicotianae INRA-310]
MSQDLRQVTPRVSTALGALDDDVDRTVAPNDYDLRMRIMYDYHVIHTTGHPDRERTSSFHEGLLLESPVQVCPQRPLSGNETANKDNVSVQGTATAHAGLVAEKEARPDKLFSSQTQDIGQHRQDLNFGTITPAPRFADPPTVLERLMCNTSHLALMAQRGRRSGASQLLEHGDTVEQPHQFRSKLNFDVQSDLICVGVLVGVLIANELGD